MMAGIFLVFLLAIVAIGMRMRLAAMSLILLGIVLCFVMLWHHATNILKINW